MLLLLLAGALCLSLQASGKPVQDEDILTVNRPWLDESEFLADDTLHATRGQNVVLHLEPWDGKGKPIRKNSLRFSVEEAERFRFCIPREDPHLLRVKLKRHGGPTLINGARGGRCEPVMLEPGRYELDIFHDSRAVPEGGRLAFLHAPEQPRLLGGDATLLGSDASSGQPNFMAFKASNGKWVSAQPNSNDTVRASGSDVWDTEIWTLAQIKDQKYSMSYDDPTFRITLDGPVAALQPLEGNVWLYQDPTGNEPLLAQFIFHDQGGWNFTLDTYWLYTTKGGSTDSAVQPVVVDPGTEQLYLGTNNPPVYETFTATLKGFNCIFGCDSDNLPLARGEVALFSECLYLGIGAVSITDTSRFAAFDVPTPGYDPPPQIVSSIRLGPGTFMELYTDYNFAGTLTGISEDQFCLLPPVPVSSFKVLTDARTFIIQTNGCVNCNLTGIDLSDLDLSGGIFTGSSFLQSDLSGTDFTGASMTGVDLSGSTMIATVFDDALLVNASLASGSLANASFGGTNLTNAAFLAATDLTGTDFSGGAVLHCTSFESSDVSVAMFDSTPDILRDLSCRLNLENATLDYNTFPVADWRYLDLSSSHMNNVPDTLSTSSAPLDLSGVNLSGVQWLAGKTLDYVNFGCYPSQPDQETVCPEPAGTAVCATLQATVLTDTSLQHACLKDASMEGVFLSFSNLDGADMSGVQLQALPDGNVALLEGAFMRNVTLSGADLTGVRAHHVNFFTASGGLADATGLTAPGADFTGAYLAFADFSGAGSLANLQGSIWTDAMLLGASFDQVDLGKDTSGGVNTGRATTFEGAYMQGVSFNNGSIIDDVDFSSTYWDVDGAGGTLNLLVPESNRQFAGYWKDPAVPECPPTLKWDDGTPPPAVTTLNNTCPDSNPGPCDSSDRYKPSDRIGSAFFQSADPTGTNPYPVDPTVTDPDLQCGGADNPADLCWTITSEPPPMKCVAGS